MRTQDRFLICPPRYYRVEYVINPWMEGNVGRARAETAAQQWQRLCDVLATHGALNAIDPVAGLPDMPFAANAGLVCKDIFIPARMRFPQRQPEARHFSAWFHAHGYRVIELPGQGTFEGEGDALFQPGAALLWGGYGVRTSLIVHRHLAAILNVEVVPLRLIDERFYHLDTCCCPLAGGRLVYYPGAFDPASLATIRGRVPAAQRCEVDADDALGFACNAIVTGATFITNHASPALRRRLGAWGFDVVCCPLHEFILAGGAAKCLALCLTHDVPTPTTVAARIAPVVCDQLIEVQGHLLDAGLMSTLFDSIADAGCSFEIEKFQPGFRHDQQSWARVRVVAPSRERLDTVLGRLMALGARQIEPERDATLVPVTRAGLAPPDFYSTTIFPTDVRLDGNWVRASGQRMDAVLVVEESAHGCTVRCALLRDLQVGERVVCGGDGIRVQRSPAAESGEPFEFMAAGVSSERRVALAIHATAREMRRVRALGGKIVVVAGPVVIHTGGGVHLAHIVHLGYVHALLGGNGLAVHDIEQAVFGTSLGVDLHSGINVHGGHRHHLKAINLVRAHGSIAKAVADGAIGRGVMYECVRHRVPFALAGSIRDDGPLPETMMDLIAAQREYARLVAGADLILMLSSMLHSIGVGNMTPAGVRLICVDISPAVVTKLADRGSIESTGIVTDVGLFLNRLDAALAQETAEYAETDAAGAAPSTASALH
ncbi:MAG: TIGR00300 family protein [Candidatus Binatia bacterium]